MMDGRDIHFVCAYWGRRSETAEALAVRWIALIARLQAVDPAFAHWTHWEDGPGFIPFDPALPAQVARVVDGTERNSAGQLVPEGGSRLWNTTDPCPRPRSFAVWMSAGNDHKYADSNSVRFNTDLDVVPDSSLTTFRVFRGVLLALAETFAATQALAWPSGLDALWDDDHRIARKLDLAWISYVGPRFAHLITPPPNAVVERRPDGGLLMAATAETFSTINPAHVAAARAIKIALEPFNAVPWTPETGK